MAITLKELAAYLGSEFQGDPETNISSLGSLDDAKEGEVTFLANPKYAQKVATTKATTVIIPPGADAFGKCAIIAANPYLAFAKTLTLFLSASKKSYGVMEGAIVSVSAVIGADATVYPGAYIGDGVKIGARTVIHPGAVIYAGAVIGDDVLIHSNVTVRESCRLGNRVILHSGAVIGSDGFGYVPDGKSHYKIPQIGIVVLEDDVEIGANTTVDRAALDVTLIRRGTKIDNLVQIGHNSIIGEDNIIVSQAGVAGSAKLGNNVTVAGQVGVGGHLTIADNVQLAARSGVMSSIESAGAYAGFPLYPHREWIRQVGTIGKLPEMKKSLASLEKKVAELEQLLLAKS